MDRAYGNIRSSRTRIFHIGLADEVGIFCVIETDLNISRLNTLFGMAYISSNHLLRRTILFARVTGARSVVESRRLVCRLIIFCENSPSISFIFVMVIFFIFSHVPNSVMNKF